MIFHFSTNDRSIVFPPSVCLLDVVMSRLMHEVFKHVIQLVLWRTDARFANVDMVAERKEGRENYVVLFQPTNGNNAHFNHGTLLKKLQVNFYLRRYELLVCACCCCDIFLTFSFFGRFLK